MSFLLVKPITVVGPAAPLVTAHPQQVLPVGLFEINTAFLEFQGGGTLGPSLILACYLHS